MKKIQELFNSPKFKHHIYGIESHYLRPDDFFEFLDKSRFSYIFAKHYDFLKIDDARMLKSLAIEKSKKESLFVISFTHINTESQNTLLKLIEEPSEKTIFFFIFPHGQKLLSTVRSRMEMISLGNEVKQKKSYIDAKTFIKMSLDERFAFIKEHTGKKKKEEENKYLFSKEDVLFFLDELETLFHKKPAHKKRNRLLESILRSREYLYANGASLKMILDNIALHI